MAKQFSLAYLTVPGIDPVAQIKLARAAGYDYVSLRTIPMGLPGEPQVCLEQDPQLASTIRQTLKEQEMKLLDIELVRVREDLPYDFRGAFEQGALLGATQVLSSVWTKDHAFAVDRYGSICEQAAEFGLTINLEFPVVSGLTTLAQTMAVQDQVNAPNLKILMDMIYAHWDGTPPEKIREMDPNRFGVIHLCDCPALTPQLETLQIMREGRAYCGEGVVDVEGLIKALPNNPCSIELPNSKRIQELGAEGHAKRCLEQAKAYFKSHGIQ